MNLDSFTGPGSTPSRRRFWDKVSAAVIASQKVQGDNVSVEEHQGMGTIINVPNPNRRPTGTTGACCDEFGGCTITTEAECTGTFKGVGTVCDPNPCCCDCPAEETLTIDIIFAGITFCDPEIYGYTGDPNGTFTLARLDTISFHGWFGTGSTDIEYFGDPQPPPLITVRCLGNTFQEVFMGPTGGEFFATAEGCPPTTASEQTCDGGFAFGGTATIDCG